MKPIRVLSVLAVVALAGLIAGCSTNSSTAPIPNSTGDQAAITGTLALAPDFMDPGLFDTSTQTNLAASLGGVSNTPASALTAVDPLFFWRQIVWRSPTLTFAFADTDSTGLPTTAVVTLQRHLVGTFNIVPRDTANPDLPDTHGVVRKPLDDLWVRRFLLKRVPLGQGGEEVWKLAAATPVEVTSKNATTEITSVRLTTAAQDTTITDPTAFLYLRKVLRYSQDDTVTVTVTTPRTDDVVLLYDHDHRQHLVNNGDGTYTGKFLAGVFTGWRHFGVNALSHGTLFDDTAPYDSKAWIFPYVLVNGPDVDYIP
jgi:hypothetical protein